MQNVNIPEGYNQVMPYLILKDAQRFFDFMQKVFDATEKLKTMRDENIIAHAELRIGESVIMFADSTHEYAPLTSSMFVYVANADEAYKIALAEGATSIMEMSDQPYGRSGGIKDPFGNVWWITTA